MNFVDRIICNSHFKTVLRDGTLINSWIRCFSNVWVTQIRYQVNVRSVIEYISMSSAMMCKNQKNSWTAVEMRIKRRISDYTWIAALHSKRIRQIPWWSRQMLSLTNVWWNQPSAILSIIYLFGLMLVSVPNNYHHLLVHLITTNGSNYSAHVCWCGRTWPDQSYRFHFDDLQADNRDNMRKYNEFFQFTIQIDSVYELYETICKSGWYFLMSYLENEDLYEIFCVSLILKKVLISKSRSWRVWESPWSDSSRSFSWDQISFPDISSHRTIPKTITCVRGFDQIFRHLLLDYACFLCLMIMDSPFSSGILLQSRKQFNQGVEIVYGSHWNKDQIDYSSLDHLIHMNATLCIVCSKLWNMTIVWSDIDKGSDRNHWFMSRSLFRFNFVSNSNFESRKRDEIEKEITFHDLFA
jgi:hypothetical protein